MPEETEKVQKPEKCPHKNVELGYGMAGGGMGAYEYCLDCETILSKTQDTGK